MTHPVHPIMCMSLSVVTLSALTVDDGITSTVQLATEAAKQPHANMESLRMVSNIRFCMFGECLTKMEHEVCARLL